MAQAGSNIITSSFTSCSWLVSFHISSQWACGSTFKNLASACSTLQRSSIFPSSTCIDLLQGNVSVAHLFFQDQTHYHCHVHYHAKLSDSCFCSYYELSVTKAQSRPHAIKSFFIVERFASFVFYDGFNINPIQHSFWFLYYKKILLLFWCKKPLNTV